MDSRRIWLSALWIAFIFAGAQAANAQCASFSLSPTSQEFAASGGTGLVTINASPPGCTTARTASTATPWITINFGQSGNGAGSVGYTVDQNLGPSQRSGSITIAGQTFAVTQAGTPCTFSISPNSQSFTSDGGTGAVTVNATPSGCQSSRTATTAASWITLSSGASGTGGGSLIYSVSANTTSSSRTATITIAGRTFTVNQAALACNYTISPSQANFPASGGSDQITITASPVGCSSPRTATSNSNWITISFGATGSGSGTVGFTVQSNAFTVARTGTITVAERTFTVNQAAGSCSFTLSPSSSTISNSGGNSGFNITASNQSCSWTAVNNTPEMISLTTGDSGTGNGRIDFSVGPNALTSSRTGSITIGNASHTVTQGSACRVTASPTGATLGGAGGTGTISVTTQGSNCAWTAVSNNDFITIPSGSSGTSSGTVNYSVAANVTGADRVGSISINDFGFTIYQSSNCTYALSSTGISLDPTGGSGSFNVATTCPWTAIPSADWIQVTPASGTGNSAIAFTVAGNTSAQARTGAVSIGSASFRINQAGVSCSVQVSPASFRSPAGGETFRVQVEAPQGCDWGASSTAGFISIARTDEGFNFTVAPNPLPESRSAVITAGDKTVAIAQDAAVCEFRLTPSRAAFTAAGGGGSFEVATTCSWTAQSQAPWIIIPPPHDQQQNGDGRVLFNVARLTGGSDSRSATIRAGSALFTITQTNSPCALNVNPQDARISGAGGRAMLRVEGGPSCKWSPVSEGDWLSISSWSSINGAGVVNLAAPPNSEVEPRQAQVRIVANGVEPQSVTVTQGGLQPAIDSYEHAITRSEGGPLAPGTRIVVKGTSMGPAEAVLADLTGDFVPADLAGVQLLFNGIPAPLYSVSRDNIVAQVPFAVAGSSSVEVVVRNNGVDSEPANMELAVSTPAIVTNDSATGRGQATALNQNGSANSPANLATRNETITFLVNGAGAVRPDAEDGRIYRQATELPVPVLPVTVQIGGQNAVVTQATVAPNETAGMIRVTARIAVNSTTGTAVPVIIRFGGQTAQTQAGVTISVR